jgi:hypothetical protein
MVLCSISARSLAGERVDMITIHVLSAAAVYTDDTRTATSHVAMCGALMGDYSTAVAAGHQVGNYISVTSPYYVAVTCRGCRTRMNERWARQRRGY